MATDAVILCPWLQQLIAELRGAWREYSYSGVQDSACDTAATSGAALRLGDRFVLQVPYCKTYLRWELLFSKHHPAVPPDVILDAAYERPGEPWFALDRCGALQQWGTDGAFLRFVEEVLEQFRARNEAIVSNFPNERVQYEYSTICGTPGVEYLVTQEEAGHRVRMMIPLAVELAALYQCFLSGKPKGGHLSLYVELLAGEDPQTVRVERSELDWPTPLLQFPWLVDHPFPPFTLSSCLVQFIPDLTASLNQVIAQRVQRYSRRKELVEALVRLFGSPLEFDAHQYTSVVFLFQTDHAWFLTVTLSEQGNYPQDAPVVHLSSVDAFNTVSGKLAPVRCRVQNFPYNPSWTAAETAETLRVKLVEVEREFADLTSDLGRHAGC